MLNTTTHFHEITKNFPAWQFIRSNVDMTNGDQQVPRNQSVSGERSAQSTYNLGTMLPAYCTTS